MEFEFTVHPECDFINDFAETFGLKIVDNRAIIPNHLGRGHVKQVVTNMGLKLVIHNYQLKDDFCIKRLESTHKNNLISIVFNSNEVPTGNLKDDQSLNQPSNPKESAIQVASSSVGTETFFPAESKICFAAVGLQRSKLKSLLQLENPNKQVGTILNSDRRFFFHECMSTDIWRAFKKLFSDSGHNNLSNLFYQVKIQELILLLFSKLLCRKNCKQYAINNEDIAKLHDVHAAVLEDISEPPEIKKLAKDSGLSTTKMKQLFKQVYGDSIYNFYLNARMEDAAHLLKHANISVAEVGHQVGYSNMSHFSKMFRKHFGMNPKKYSSVG